ncbi:MAG: tRNA 2-thiocytidine(32) synthetase TtcA [Desulfuromonadales bacterium C00003094]|nr:MAG: tRNA 2-thiocytidine(32) synthetase TtcA [Desulfuromonadales bacterium C00003094]
MAIIEDRLFRKIRKEVGKAISDFNLIEEGDRIAVAVSGGKDSYTLLHILDNLRRRAPVRYELIAVNVHPGFPGYRTEPLEQHLKQYDFACRMERTDCYQIIEAKRRPDSSYCAFCARLRRGVLYAVADELGCNKLALGHHADDFIETLLLNQFFCGSLKAMSPKLLADNGRHTVIRPLVYVEERLIAEFSYANDFPTIACACPAGSDGDRNRRRIKQLIKELSGDMPHLRGSLLSALGNIQPRHLLDKRFNNF